ncbi:MAG: hypothetical protein R3F53_05375 [Gammaproteobacteria bacterium]
MEPSTHQTISTLREKIAALHAERDALPDQPLDIDSIRTQLAANIAGNRSFFEQSFNTSQLFYPLAAGAILKLPTGPINGPERPQEALWSLACWVHGETLIDPLMTLVEQRLPKDAGISLNERNKRLKKIESELLRLEREEEKLICELEAAGDEIIRRADADPAIVLEAA